MPITIKELLSRLAEAKAKSAKKTTDAPVEAPAKKVVAKTPAKRKPKVKPQPAAQEEPQTTTRGFKADWDSPDAPFGSNFDKRMAKIVGDTKDSEYETLRAILKKNYPDKTDTQIDVELDKAGHKMPMPTDPNDPDFAAKDALWKANQARLTAYKADPSANLATIDAQVAKTYGLGEPSKKSDAPVEEPVADIPSASSTPEPEPKVAEPEKKPIVGPETTARLQKNAGIEPEVVPSPDTTPAAEPTPPSTPGVRVSTEPTTPIPLDVVAEPDKPVAPAVSSQPASAPKVSAANPKSPSTSGVRVSKEPTKPIPLDVVAEPEPKVSSVPEKTPKPAPTGGFSTNKTSGGATAVKFTPTVTSTPPEKKPTAGEPSVAQSPKTEPTDTVSQTSIGDKGRRDRLQPGFAPRWLEKKRGIRDRLKTALRGFTAGTDDDLGKPDVSYRNAFNEIKKLMELMVQEGIVDEQLTADEWAYILTETTVGRELVEQFINEGMESSMNENAYTIEEWVGMMEEEGGWDRFIAAQQKKGLEQSRRDAEFDLNRRARPKGTLQNPDANYPDDSEREDDVDEQNTVVVNENLTTDRLQRLAGIKPLHD